MYNLHQYFCYLQKMFASFRKKKQWKQEANIGPKIKQTTSI